LVLIVENFVVTTTTKVVTTTSSTMTPTTTTSVTPTTMPTTTAEPRPPVYNASGNFTACVILSACVSVNTSKAVTAVLLSASCLGQEEYDDMRGCILPVFASISVVCYLRV